MLGTVPLTGPAGIVDVAAQGYTLYGGIKAGINLAQDVFRGPLIELDLRNTDILSTPSALVGIGDLDELKEAAKSNSLLSGILAKGGYSLQMAKM